MELSMNQTLSIFAQIQDLLEQDVVGFDHRVVPIDVDPLQIAFVAIATTLGNLLCLAIARSCWACCCKPPEPIRLYPTPEEMEAARDAVDDQDEEDGLDRDDGEVAQVFIGSNLK